MKTTTATLVTCLALALLAGCSTPPPAKPAAAQRPIPFPAELVKTPEEIQAERAARTSKVGTLEIYHDRTERGWMRGTIKNVGTEPVRYVRVRIDYLDTDKKVIHSDWDFAVDSLVLKPGEERQWSLVTRTPTGMKSYRVYPVL